jgi:phenylacetic acid degradation operon negative regulatory protein
LTPAGEQLLVEGTKRIYEFGVATPVWDGRWLLVLASVPESDRAVRHLVRTRLRAAGLGNGGGMWIGTHADRAGEVEEVLADAGILDTAQVFVAERLDTSDVRTLVASAWDLDALAEDYERFVDEFRSAAAADPLVRVLELVHAWRRFPWRDPALPHELLPAKWKGLPAVALFRERHAAWSPPAMAEWVRISGG